MIDKNFENGCVLVVGGSGGIGSLCAKEFANTGAKNLFSNQWCFVEDNNNWLI